MAAELNHFGDYSEDLETDDEIETGINEVELTDDSSDELNDPEERTPGFHAQQGLNSMKLLKKVVSEPGWKRIIKHKSGLNVWSKPGIDKSDKLPLLKGEHIIHGFTPQAIFTVIGMRKLWDDWYEEGNLVENLNETTSLTYMVMKGLAGSKTRDLSLVEKVECAPNGVVYFASSSITTPKVPRVTNKIRAQLKLNGWILDPVTVKPPTTKVTYVLQTNVKGMIPSFAVKKYMSRRPLVILNIESYLQKNGPPPVVVATTTPTTSREPSSESKRPNHQTVHGNGTKITSQPQRKLVIANKSEEESSESITDSEENEPEKPLPAHPATPYPVFEDPFISEAYTTSVKTGSIRKITQQSQQKSRSPKKSILQNDHNFSEPPLPQIQDQSSIIQHRHNDSILNAFSTLRGYIKTLDDWQFSSQSRGVKIYTKTIPGRAMPIIRGESVITGGWTAEDILATILDPNCRCVWDDRFEGGTIIERFTADEMLLKSSIKGTFPISPRDFCTVASTQRDTNSGIIWNAGISVTDPLVPESKEYVRAELYLAGWILRPRFDFSGRTISVHVTYIIDLDIKLGSTPFPILTDISISTPLCIATIGEYLQENGCPPYLRSTTGKLVSAEFNTNTLQYDMKIEDVNGGSVELCANRKTYPTGFDISIQPEEVEVELLSDNTEIIRITVPERSSFKTLSIKLTQQPSEDSQLTLNGAYDIPITEKSNDPTSITFLNVQEERSLVPKPSSKKQKHIVPSTRYTSGFK